MGMFVLSDHRPGAVIESTVAINQGKHPSVSTAQIALLSIKTSNLSSFGCQNTLYLQNAWLAQTSGNHRPGAGGDTCAYTHQQTAAYTACSGVSLSEEKWTRF